MPEPLDTRTMTRAQHDEELARAALLEITPAATVGDATGRQVAEDGVVTLTFAAEMAGYPGWHWTVTLGEVDGFEPTVLEAELLPGDGALLAPDWVPWSVRLEEYRAAQAAAGEPDEAVGESGDEDEGDEDDLDLDDLGDDPDDGIDFEGHLGDPEVGEGESDDDVSDEAAADPSGLPPVDVDEQQQAEPQSDEDGPQPPRRPRRQNRRQKQE
jgi:hypothetical protein